MLLESLKFKPGTQNIEMARHELLQLLANPMQTRLGERPKLVILLDGLNESSGETKGLLQEISELSQMQGVRKILGENGVLMPQQEALAELLRSPMMLCSGKKLRDFRIIPKSAGRWKRLFLLCFQNLQGS